MIHLIQLMYTVGVLLYGTLFVPGQSGIVVAGVRSTQFSRKGSSESLLGCEVISSAKLQQDVHSRAIYTDNHLNVERGHLHESTGSRFIMQP